MRISEPISQYDDQTGRETELTELVRIKKIRISRFEFEISPEDDFHSLSLNIAYLVNRMDIFCVVSLPIDRSMKLVQKHLWESVGIVFDILKSLPVPGN